MTKRVSVRTRRIGVVLLSLLLAVGTIPLFGVSADTAVDRLQGWGVFTDTADTLAWTTDETHGGVLEMTKGPTATVGTGWNFANLTVDVEPSTTYHLSIDLKGSGTHPFYILRAVYFTENWNVVNDDIRPGNREGDLPMSWMTVDGDFTTTETTGKVQLRVVFQGAAGDTMRLDNVSICPLKKTPVLSDAWKYADWGDPDEPYQNLTLTEAGCTEDNVGAVHIYRDYFQASDKKNVAICQSMRNLSAGTFVLELSVKGNTGTSGDPLMLRLLDKDGDRDVCEWVDVGSADYRVPVAAYAEWNRLSIRFTATDAYWHRLWIGAGGYAGVDCYVDNIVVYKESDSSKTNLLTGGDFYVSEPDTTQELIVNGGFEVAQHTVTLDGVAYKTVYDGDTLDLSAAAPVKDGAWFKGYYTDAECTKPFVNGSAITADTALYSGWITVEQQPQVEAVQVRLVGVEGLRFVSQISQTAVEELEALDSAAEIGTIVAPNPDVRVTGAFDLSVVDGKYIKKVPAVNRLQAGQDYDEDGTVKFTAVVIQIPEKNYASDIAARTYVTYTDASGIQRSYYSSESASEYYATNLAATAQATLNQHGDTLTETEKTRLEAIVAAAAA